MRRLRLLPPVLLLLVSAAGAGAAPALAVDQPPVPGVPGLPTGGSPGASGPAPPAGLAPPVGAPALPLPSVPGGPSATTPTTGAPDTLTLGADTLTCTGRTAADDATASYRLCSGYVHSFDGVPLDVDVTLPASGSGPWDLLVMLHGWGSSKSDWESTSLCGSNADRCDYNNAYFATKQGLAVLNYSARGFHGSCGPDTPNSLTPSCATGWTHLGDRRYEIHDTQYLAGLLADAGVGRPGVAVTGDSYGGGQSLLLAAQRDLVTQTDGTTIPWTSPKGTAMKIAVAVPKYPWSDLAHSLLPNGRASDGVIVPDGDRTNPIGVMKQSYVSGLYALGQTTARYAPPGVDPTADLVTWFALINAGESPAQAAAAGPVYDQVTRWKSAYYQDALIARQAGGGGGVPILDIQGFTDPLFPEFEGASFMRKLKAADPAWPVWLYASDVGHAYAANKKDDWAVINAQAAAFIAYHLGHGGGLPPAAVQEQVTTCGGTGGGPVISASSLDGVAPGRWRFDAPAAGRRTVNGPTDGAAAPTDPIGFSAHGGSGCVKLASAPPAGPAVTSFSWPVTADLTLVGAPALDLELAVTGPDAVIASRVWDVAPDGSMTLVTRGVARWSSGSRLTYSLEGNGWVFPAGHTLRLDVTQDDAPYVRLDNYPSTVTYSAVHLVLPVLGASGATGDSGAGQGDQGGPGDQGSATGQGGVSDASAVAAHRQGGVLAATGWVNAALAATGLSLALLVIGLALIGLGAAAFAVARRHHDGGA